MRDYYNLDFKGDNYSYKANIVLGVIGLIHLIGGLGVIVFTNKGANLIGGCVLSILAIFLTIRFLLYKDLFVNRLGVFDEYGVHIYTVMNKKGAYISYEEFNQIRIIPTKYNFINDFSTTNSRISSSLYIPETLRFAFCYDEEVTFNFNREDDHINGMSIREYGTTGYNFTLYYDDDIFNKIISNISIEKRRLLEEDLNKSIEILNKLDDEFIEKKKEVKAWKEKQQV